MSEEALAEQMARYQTVAEEARDAARERDRIGRDLGQRLAAHVEEAIDEAGARVEAVERSADGETLRFEARLDRAAMVAALTETLPDGFVVSHVTADGSLTVEWTGSGRTPGKRERGAVLKAIIAEETDLDADGLITASPTRERVLDRAEELGVDRAEAADRLARLAQLDVVDVDDGTVYPDENFARF